MLHPSYSELINIVNSECDTGDEPVVQSRYSIVIATARRARQLISANFDEKGKKPLSQAVSELRDGKIKILSESEAADIIEMEEEYYKTHGGEDGMTQSIPVVKPMVPPAEKHAAPASYEDANSLHARLLRGLEEDLGDLDEDEPSFDEDEKEDETDEDLQ